MTGTKGIAAQFFRAITESEVNVMAIAQGSSEKNISVVVNKDDLHRAVQFVHNSFFTGKTKLIIGLVGLGNVGEEFYRQVDTQKDNIYKDFNVEINFVAMSNSSHMILSDTISESDIGSLKGRDQSCQASDVGEIIDFLTDSPGNIKVLIDCTASDVIPDLYARCFEAKINVITANKKGLSGSIDRYEDIIESAQKNNCNFLYETTAGAALPFIKSVKDFTASGDKIKEIEGVFSGTLAYLFNTFDGEKLFSEIVSNAKDQGYTEPDPRDDLSGMDVARKLVILAREMGQYIEVEDVEIENLVNKSHQDLSVEDYLKAMADDDQIIQSRYQQANDEGKALCYIAQLNGKGEASVTLKAIDQDHQFFGLEGTENIIKYKTERYSSYPLVHRGPGAGPEVTAAGIFSDLLALLNTH
jgi:aspartokinase/homoserine dehydrogenase 1